MKQKIYRNGEKIQKTLQVQMLANITITFLTTDMATNYVRVGFCYERDSVQAIPKLSMCTFLVHSP
jgi:hypothetical protein